MALRLNAKTFRTTLSECLKSDAEIMSSASEIFAFYAAASAGGPLAYAAGIALIAKAAAAATKGISEVIKRVSDSRSEIETAIPAYERFRVVYYAACLNSYLGAIQSGLKKLKAPEEDQKTTKAGKTATEKELLKTLQANLNQVNESEAPFLLGVDPLEGEVPLFVSLNSWMGTLLSHYGYPEYVTHGILQEAIPQARQRFRTFVASDSKESEWIRNYLVLTNHAQTEKIASDLSTVRLALESWMPKSGAMGSRHREAWDEYRRALVALPDQKDSMYNEDFGVRAVFVRPQGTYSIAGGAGAAGTPQHVQDLGSVLGGLISGRVSGEDLIILCGGPGSGKSTLSRILASELAQDPNVFPVFLRLRRLKEGVDIPAFLETELSRIGVIDHVRDLRDLKNAVIILDGFDELVMASRARLRHFFNSIKEDHLNGALKGTRIVVSGRDTLFPGGEGLPLGCHVLTLRPFDRPRVALWGRKWRACHETGGGATFRPEKLLLDRSEKASPLQHLVTWPLTLHLVARVHTSGLLQIAGDRPGSVTKAILYRSILADTSKRQREQADGSGRLEPQQMREFLRELAWRMYEEGRDSMDPVEVSPILRRFFPGRTEADLGELADVAVVNSPEITKGEQTGFEFVHKSFAEYLTAERMSIAIERVTFQAQDFDTAELTWRRSNSEACAEIAEFAAIRLLTEEVQEMLEPMLGDFPGFMGTRIPADEFRRDGLLRIVDRFGSLLDSLIRGNLYTALADQAGGERKRQSHFESVANLAAGIVLVGAAAARQLAAMADAGKNSAKFCLQPFDGAIWRLLCVLHAGGLFVDEKLAYRLFSGCTISREGKKVSDLDLPIKSVWLSQVEGFSPMLGRIVGEDRDRIDAMGLAVQLAILVVLVSLSPSEELAEAEHELMYAFERVGRGGWPTEYGLPAAAEVLARSGFLDMDDVRQEGNYGRVRHEFYRLLESRMGDGQEFSDRFSEFASHLDYLMSRSEGPNPLSILTRVVIHLLFRVRSRRGNSWFADRMRPFLRRMR